MVLSRGEMAFVAINCGLESSFFGGRHKQLYRCDRRYCACPLDRQSTFATDLYAFRMSLNVWSSEQYNKAAGFVAREFGESLLDMLKPQRGECILDLGCGDGVLTEQLRLSGAIVKGVDSSESMVDAARRAYPELDVEVMDACALTFSSDFDVVFSNAALHWMLEPDAVIEGVKLALKPGGRFIAEFGGKGNVDSIVQAFIRVLKTYEIDGHEYIPWYFPDIEDYQRRLSRGGFKVRSIELYSRPTRLPDGMKSWLKTFGDSFLRPLPNSQHDEFLDKVVADLKPFLCDGNQNWTADYVRLRFEAHL